MARLGGIDQRGSGPLVIAGNHGFDLLAHRLTLQECEYAAHSRAIDIWRGEDGSAPPARLVQPLAQYEDRQDCLRRRTSSAGALPVASCSPDTEQVVADLEPRPRARPNSAHRDAVASSAPPRSAPAQARRSDDRGRLARDHLEILASDTSGRASKDRSSVCPSTMAIVIRSNASTRRSVRSVNVGRGEAVEGEVGRGK